jgi:hypothetical protein
LKKRWQPPPKTRSICWSQLACRACKRRRPLVTVVGRYQVAGCASRGSEWRATAYSTPTIHCTVRLFLGVISGWAGSFS